MQEGKREDHRMDMEMFRFPLSFQFYPRGGVLVTVKRTGETHWITPTQWKWIVDNRQWAIGQESFSLPQEEAAKAPDYDQGAEGEERVYEIVSEDFRQMRYGKLQELSQGRDARTQGIMGGQSADSPHMPLLSDESGSASSGNESERDEISLDDIRPDHSAGCVGCGGGECNWT